MRQFYLEKWDEQIGGIELCLQFSVVSILGAKSIYIYVVERKRKNIGQNGFSTPILYAYNEMLLHRF